MKDMEDEKRFRHLVAGSETADMVYIPPSVAHEGTTLEESLSYSIGFKSLEDETVFQSYCFH